MEIGFSSGFAGIPPFILLVFGIVAVVIAVQLIRTAVRFASNATSPIRSAHARVVAKRTQVRQLPQHYHQHSDDMDFPHQLYSVRTSYYVTFALQDGVRLELVVSGPAYGVLVEGDEGVLQYQGEWFKGFTRGV